MGVGVGNEVLEKKRHLVSYLKPGHPTPGEEAISLSIQVTTAGSIGVEGSCCGFPCRPGLGGPLFSSLIALGSGSPLGELGAWQGRSSRPMEGWRRKPHFHTIPFISSEQTSQEPLKEARGQQVQPTLRDFLEEVEPGAGSSQMLGNGRHIFLPATPLGGPRTSRGRWGGQELPSPPRTSHLPPVQGRLGHLLCEALLAQLFPDS